MERKPWCMREFPPPRRYHKPEQRYFTHPQGWISLKKALAAASAFFLAE